MDAEGQRCGEHAAPKLHGHGLLKKELSNGAVDDEDGEGDAAKVLEDGGAQELGKPLGAPRPGALAVDAHEEDDPQGHEDHAAHEHVIDVHQPCCPKHDDSKHCKQGQQRGARLAGALVVEHDQAARRGSHEHLHGRSEWAEAHCIEERVIRVRPGAQHALHDTPGPQVVAVAELGDKAQQGQEGQRPPELPLLLQGKAPEGVGQHAQAEGKGGQEPGRRVPDLRGEREPGL
mmetsp:Transcript_54305/g.174107  ORF Transcript_54305/g.174107 Transcript_54305/m.174107 type:complete len:232 (+) Transcript_54305:511-1206(+)